MTVDTGGFRAEELRAIEASAQALGVTDRRVVDARSVVVETILTDPMFSGLIRAHRYCANDLVAASGGVEWLRARNLPVNLVAGPATDNHVGMRYIRDTMGLEAANARTDPERFAHLVEQAAFARKPA